MVPPVLTLLIGFPGSGKSTWRAAALRFAERPTAVVSTDDLILEHARVHGLTYAEAWRRLPSHKMDSWARAQVRTAVAAGMDVVVDRTNLRAVSRARFLRLAPEGWLRRAVVLVTPPETLRARLQARAAAGGHAVAWGFVVGMMKGYEAPRPGEFDRIDFLGSGLEVLAVECAARDRV